MKLAGKVALITGGKRIGGAIAEELARRGVGIALSYARSRQEAELTAAAVRAGGARVELFAADLSLPDECYRLVADVAKAFERIDVLIHMASVYRQKPFEELNATDWNATIDVDLRAAFLCATAVAPHMRAQGEGRIVNFSDWVASSGRPRYRGYVPYYVAKAGVIALTEALALELASERILVNAIAPGPIVPPPGSSVEEVRAVEASTPLGRWGGPDEIVKAVILLLETDFITGETLRVDGGRHIK